MSHFDGSMQFHTEPKHDNLLHFKTLKQKLIIRYIDMKFAQF